MSSGLEIQVEESEDKSVLRLEGRIDASSASILEKQIGKHLDGKSSKLLLDFTKIAYLSSAGMRILLSATKKFKGQGGLLFFFGMNKEVMDIVKMAGFERILPIYPNEKKALEALKNS